MHKNCTVHTCLFQRYTVLCIQCKLYIVHTVVSTVRCIIYLVNCKLCSTDQVTLPPPPCLHCTALSNLYTILDTWEAVHSTLFILQYAHCILKIYVFIVNCKLYL